MLLFYLLVSGNDQVDHIPKYIPNTSLINLYLVYWCAPAAWQVLTRQHQLSLKEKKKADKAKAKEEKEGLKEQKKAEKDALKKANAKTKGKAKADKVEKDVEEEKPVVEENHPKPKRLRKLTTEEAECKPEEAEEPAQPRAKAKAKAKAKQEPKRKARSKAAAKPEKDELPSEDDEVETPKKRLFTSDEEDDDDDAESEHLRMDSKSGTVMPLKNILEKEKPGTHAQGKKTNNSTAAAPGASGVHEMENVKPKRGKRKQAAATRKAAESPFTKKEKARRKKTEVATMQQKAEEDKQTQGICIQHMKNVHKLPFDEVKKYLRTHLTNERSKDFKLNEYWSRPACGVKVPCLGDGTMRSAPEVAYFKSYGTCPDGWNLNVAAVYVSASLMVSKLYHLAYCGLCF